MIDTVCFKQAYENNDGCCSSSEIRSLFWQVTFFFFGCVFKSHYHVLQI